MSDRNDFYVYVLLDPRKPGEYKYGEFVFPYEPIYVGKGSKGRAVEHFYIRNCSKERGNYKSRKIKKIYEETGLKPIIIKIYENLYEDVSFEVEKFLIAQIGRNNLRKGPLTNLTDGGDGISGCIYTEESRRKMSESKRGENNPNFGKNTSEEIRQKMSEVKRGENNSFFGKTHSEESKQKMSEVKRGENHPFYRKTHSEESKRKMSVARTGKTHSEESKRKIRDARLKYWERKHQEAELASQTTSPVI